MIRKIIGIHRLVWTIALFLLTGSTIESSSDQKYETIIIGTQEWMAYNLQTTFFRNGEAIPRFTDYESWEDLGNKQIAAYGYNARYDDEISSRNFLYNWYAVNDPRGLCPTGFRVPSYDDFSRLIDHLAAQLQDNDGLTDKSEKDYLDFGLTMPGWCCMQYDDDMDIYFDEGNNEAFWINTELSSKEIDSYYLCPESAWILDVGRSVRTDSDGVFFNPESTKKMAFSVRCIKE